MVIVYGKVLEEENKEYTYSCIKDVKDHILGGIDVGTIDVIDECEEKGSEDHFALLISGEHLDLEANDNGSTNICSLFIFTRRSEYVDSLLMSQQTYGSLRLPRTFGP